MRFHVQLKIVVDCDNSIFLPPSKYERRASRGVPRKIHRSQWTDSIVEMSQQIGVELL